MAKLAGKVAIVTGGDSGIGRASAVLMAQEGAKVVMANRNEKQGKEAEDEISRAGGQATFIRTDVTKPEDIQAMVRMAVEKYGSLDILFNNAGTVGERLFTADSSVENWQKVIDLCLTGVFLGMKYAIPEMLKNGGGSIINNSSTASMKVITGQPAYAAAKAGVIMLTKTAAVEYGSKGIRVNAIQPGSIWTPGLKNHVEAFKDELVKTIPLGRFGAPEEVAKLVLFLASDESSYITGAAILIDGAYTAP